MAIRDSTEHTIRNIMRDTPMRDILLCMGEIADEFAYQSDTENPDYIPGNEAERKRLYDFWAETSRALAHIRVQFPDPRNQPTNPSDPYNKVYA